MLLKAYPDNEITHLVITVHLCKGNSSSVLYGSNILPQACLRSSSSHPPLPNTNFYTKGAHISTTSMSDHQVL